MAAIGTTCAGTSAIGTTVTAEMKIIVWPITAGIVVVVVVAVVIVGILVKVQVMLRSFSFCRAFVFSVAQQKEINVGRAELGEFAIVAKDDDCDLRVGQDSQLVRFLEEAGFALEVSDGSVAILLDGLDLDLLATHLVVLEKGCKAVVEVMRV